VRSHGGTVKVAWFIFAEVTIAAGLGLAQTGAPERKATMADSIEMTTLGDAMYELGGPSAGRVAIFSPAGDRFVVVLKKGDLEKNVNVYTMLLYESDRALHSPAPVTLVAMASGSNRPAIEDVKWLGDGRTILFIGERDNDVPEIFALDVASKRLTAITHHPTPVLTFDATDDGRTILYEAAPPRKLWVDPSIVRRDGLAIGPERPDQLLSGDCHYERKPYEYGAQLFVQRGGVEPRQIPFDDRLTELERVSLSPNGRYGLVTVSVEKVPDSWIGYTDRLIHSYVESYRSAGKTISLLRYMLVDVERSESSPLIDAPLEWQNAGWAWMPDGDSVVVSGAYLPLETATDSERNDRRTRAYVVQVELPGKKATAIADDRVTVVRFGTTGNLVLRKGEGGSASYKGFHLDGSGWSPVSLRDEDLTGGRKLNVDLEEDMNHPPRIYVSTPGSSNRVELLDPNPQFSKIQFAKIEAVTWKATDGHEVRGGLYLPPDYRSGVRYPCVLQTHGFDPDRFWMDGLWTSAFAAQALAAEGIVVLQIGKSAAGDDIRYARTHEKVVRAAATYQGAIDYLDARGLIDRRKVGIIGFSYTVFEVEYTLTHTRYDFAAATVADGFDGGYLNFLLYPEDSESPLVNGGLPFGEGLQEWFENSPGFNFDKVSAPVRIETYGFDSLLGGWQVFESLKVLKKPVDYVWLPYATHLLVKPWERMVSQQGNVDWFSFWLKGQIDPDPKKENQYRRWQQLRALAAKKP
jgi:hypothetical protein